ncbi:MAG: peptidoglycan editing factor PgeF [Holosporales bacterium]|jgi:YfiH family protein|nr:peptidoglycan editing factor PgeF [Holosporales bacterium]
MNIIQSDLLKTIDFINHGFFDRTGGESVGELFKSLNVGLNSGDDDKVVLKNRKKIAEYFGVELSNLVILNQKHGDVARVVNEDNIEQYKFKDVKQALLNEGDAIITNQKGLLIGLATADCAPILLCDKEAKFIAAVHAGWRGAIGKIIENTLQKMKELGCKQIEAAVGPCIHKRYFEVQTDVIKLVDRKYLLNYEGKTLFDMPFLILDKLMKNGVKSVSQINFDTMSNDNYFSYRRQAGTTGRQFSGIMIKE